MYLSDEVYNMSDFYKFTDHILVKQNLNVSQVSTEKFEDNLSTKHICQ